MSSEYNTMRDAERAPEIADLHLEPRPDGPAAAAMLAAGIGVFTLGLLTTLSEASTAVHDWLEAWDFDQGVGPLAGKTTLTVIVWLVSWIVLAVVLWKKEVRLKAWFWVSVVLGVLGFLGTFPPFFQSFVSE
ncbi:MAG TPA: hypothetical protein VFT27_05230 [Actinomycetota bacterium]|nr:hypothetical protein [Actinomycetota bacterium]